MKLLLLASIVFLTGGLFIGGPDYYDKPVIKELWQSGHFMLFFFLSFYLFVYSKLNCIEGIKRSITILGMLLLAALLTETLQLLVGRNFEAKDILNDLLGTLTGLLIPYCRFKSNPGRSVLLVLLFTSLFFFSQKPLISEVIREMRIQWDFPVLSDFETPSQIDRWQPDFAKLSISESKVKDDRFSMRAELLPGKYPGIILTHFHRNWQGYQFIDFSIYLDAEYPMDLRIKIHDRQHPASGYNYKDRFNDNLSLKPGWNDFSLSLQAIEDAPEERSMNMKKIVTLSLFTVDLKQNTTLFIDNVRLTKNL